MRSWQQAYVGLVPDDYLASLSVDVREEQWLDMLCCITTHILLAVEHDTVIGFISYGQCRDEDADETTAEIMAFYIAPPYWRQGIGRALWRECSLILQAEGYKTVSLWVVSGNIRGSRFYEALGFELDNCAIEQFELGGATLQEQRYNLEF